MSKRSILFILNTPIRPHQQMHKEIDEYKELDEKDFTNSEL